MKPNTIKDITDFIFLGKDFEELSHYDLLIINADWAEEQLAKDIRIMFDRNIIDKDTLYPAVYYDSLTVITKDSGLADCLSTALYCMPLDEGKKLVDSLDGVDCIWIESDGNIEMTDRVKDLVVK